MKVAVKQVIVVLLGAWLALFAGSPVAVAQLSGGSVLAGPETGGNVASGEPTTVSLDASAGPPTEMNPYCTVSNNPTSWSWSVASSPSWQASIDQPDPSSPAATLTVTFSSPGTYWVPVTATATWTDSCGNMASSSGSTSVFFTAVGVQKLQYLQSGTYIDVPGTLYVLVGQSLSFQAVPTPNGSSFPSGQPIWSGSSGASGTGPTCSVAFSTLSISTSDYKTVTATCGNTYATADVIVYDFFPTLTPEDNFSGRDLDNYGVCEYVDLTYYTTPSGITASQIGGLQWQITSGGGTLIDNGDGTGTYQCPDVAATVNLTLAITGGPMLGQKKAAPAKGVVPPDGAKVLQQPGSMLWHVNDTCSVGFCGDYYATCEKVVSFKQIVVREGACVSTADGFYSGLNNFAHPASAAWCPLKDLVAGKGYQFDLASVFTRGYDKISSGDKAGPYAVGTFLWPIPNQYKQNGAADGTAKQYATANQKFASDAAGKCTISKAGSGDFSKNAGDASSTPPNWN